MYRRTGRASSVNTVLYCTVSRAGARWEYFNFRGVTVDTASTWCDVVLDEYLGADIGTAAGDASKMARCFVLLAHWQPCLFAL